MKQDSWRAIDIAAPVTTLAPALRAIAGGPGKQAAEIRAALSGGSGAAGGYTLSDDMHDQFVAMTSRGISAVQAGARVIQLEHDDLTIPRVLAGPTPEWRAENGAVGESAPTFEAATLTPRSLSMLVKISRELLADGFEMDRVLTEAIGAGVAHGLDRACYRGTGIAPQPLGLFERPLLTLAGEDDTPLNSWRSLNNALWNLRTKPIKAEANAIISTEVMIGEMEALAGREMKVGKIPETLGKLSRIDSRGMGPVAGDPANCFAAVIGDFRQMLIGWRGDIRIELLREAYAGTGQVGFMVHARVGFELLNPWAFLVLRKLKPYNVEPL